jgi:monoamine oxidase
VDYVISTLPQALFASDIDVTRHYRKTDHIAEETHTWMQDSIKVAFVYTEPFWRNKNYSGTLFSNVGPITEFYDQSNAELTKFALCGFISRNDVLSKERLVKNTIRENFWSGSTAYVLSRDCLVQRKQTKSSKQIVLCIRIKITDILI